MRRPRARVAVIAVWVARHGGFSRSMPIAFKEWAVTVRALAEGEQLLTLRKGGIREEHRHFELEHDRFFLYPTFDHQAGDLVRESHKPELAGRSRRASGRTASRPPAPAAPGRRHPAARPRPHPRLGRGRRELPDHRPALRRRALALLRVDHRLRREAAGVEAPPPAARDRCCAPTGSRGRSPSRCATSTAAAARGWRSTATCPFEGTPVLSDDEFERAAEEIEAIASDAVPVFA